MAVTWLNPKNPNPPTDGAMRTAIAQCTTGTENATAGLTDGLDLRGVAALAVAIEMSQKSFGTIRIQRMVPGDTVTVNGQVLTATKQDSQPNNAQFKVGVDIGPDNGDDYITAANLAAAINANPALSAVVSAFVASDEPIVTITALADGVNAFALAASAHAALSGAALQGGIAAGQTIAPNATLAASMLNPATNRWNRAQDLDIVLPAGAGSANAAPALLPVPAGRIQYVPQGVGQPCIVTISGFSGRQP